LSEGLLDRKEFHADQGIANITSLSELLAAPMKLQIPDPYPQCAELDHWDLYAMDGHYHKAACFDPRSVSSKGKRRAIATGHFFRMNMRNHHMSCLGMANPEDRKKKAHDMTVIKRSSAGQLRNGAPKGRKVMLIWDKACINYRQWFKLKHTHGIYFSTLEKANSTAQTCAIDQVELSDPRNEGIVSDHLVSTSMGVTLRRIVYVNPEDGVTYSYLTRDFTLPAYQIVLLYKHRWDIEKIFHQFKSKMNERKSWGSSLEAKQGHALFECLAHNLLLLFEQYLNQSEGLRDELEEKKQQGRSKAAVTASVAAGIIRTARNFINTALTRATQRTQRFIRWVRVWIYKEAPWRDSIARLRQVWATTSAWFSTPIVRLFV